MPAPVLLFTYDRLDHLSNTVNALCRNREAGQTDLIVISDGARGKDDSERVEKVRSYVQTIQGYRSVKLICRPENFGLADSVIDGVNWCFKRYERAIILEDDLITSPYFLSYMNRGLDKYAYDHRVVSIVGYQYPVSGLLPESFFLEGADCLGWATWRRGWKLFRSDGAELLRELRMRRLTRKFNFNHSYDFEGMLEAQASGTGNSWAVRWYASAFLAGGLTLYPGRSLVYHAGNDGTGTNVGTSKMLDVELTKTPIGSLCEDIRELRSGRQAVEKFFRKHQLRIQRQASHVMSLRTQSKLWARIREIMPRTVFEGLRSFLHS